MATRKKRATQRAAPGRPLPLRLGEAVIWALVLVAPLLFWPTARDAFRLPKLLAAEWLGLASLVFLSWRLRAAGRISSRDVAARPVLQALAPLLLVATLTLATTAHPEHARQGLADLWIGAACLAGWSLALPAARLKRLLGGLAVPALALAVLAVLQFHDLWEPLRFARAEEERRMGITSLAGNPGDLGAFLVLPCLLAQHALWAGSRRRWPWAVVLAATLYGLGVSQSLTALAALAAGTAVLWGQLLPRRRALALLGAAAALGALLLAVGPVRERVRAKAGELRRGEVNRLLTGRLDGWRAAARMLAERPLAGVGHGAYRAEFIPVKLALAEEGVAFFPGQLYPVFANAHNDYLEAAAEWGAPGVAALAWGLVLLWRRSGRIGGSDPGFGAAGTGLGERALARAGIAALAVLALTLFPFRVALTAYPALLWLAWTFRAAEESEAAG